MSIGRPKSELVFSDDERVQLSSLAGSRSLPHAIVARAKVVLWSAEGLSNSEIADPVAVDQSNCRKMAVTLHRAASAGALR